MERLTWEYKDGGMFVDESEVKTYQCDDVLMHTGNAIIKLAAYEDSNLTPEEAKQLKDDLETEKTYSEYWKEQTLKTQKLMQNFKSKHDTWKRESLSDKDKLQELRDWLYDNDLDMDDILRKVNK